MDWNTSFPFILIASIILLGIGLYSMITSKKFLRIVFGLEILFFASILLLLSFGLGNNDYSIIPDPLAHVFSILLIVVSIVFLIIGISIDKRLKQSGDSTIVDFNFYIEGIQLQRNSELNDSDRKKDLIDN